MFDPYQTNLCNGSIFDHRVVDLDLAHGFLLLSVIVAL